jgi:hypothetical protein
LRRDPISITILAREETKVTNQRRIENVSGRDALSISTISMAGQGALFEATRLGSFQVDVIEYRRFPGPVSTADHFFFAAILDPSSF